MAGGVLQWRMILNRAALCLCPWVGGRGNELSVVEGADLGFQFAHPGSSCQRSLPRTGPSDAFSQLWTNRKLASTRLAMRLRGGVLGCESGEGGGTEPLACTVEDDKVWGKGSLKKWKGAARSAQELLVALRKEFDMDERRPVQLQYHDEEVNTGFSVQGFGFLTLSLCTAALQFGEPGLFPDPELTELYREPSMPT